METLPSPSSTSSYHPSTISTIGDLWSLSLPYITQFLSIPQLQALSLVDTNANEVCDLEWRLRFLARFGQPSFTPQEGSWRRMFQLRRHLARNVVDRVSARVYLMNAHGVTQRFPAPAKRSLLSSRERAAVYAHCERMFDLSLRINRSVQQISALLGVAAIDAARGLLQEHLSLLSSVASLRGSLLFESELYTAIPAPVLLDANALLRGTFAFPDAAFSSASPLMMQVWASIDDVLYRPISSPCILESLSSSTSTDADRSGGNDTIAELLRELPQHTRQQEYNAVKLQELSGMTIHLDDNSLRYRLQNDEIVVNALVGNTYLLYLFNPVGFRPMDWSYSGTIEVGGMKHHLPCRREGVFTNSNSAALRIFLSYGRVPEHAYSAYKEEHKSVEEERDLSMEGRWRGANDSWPLEIACQDIQVLTFTISATNRVTKEVKQVVTDTSCVSIQGSNVVEKHIRIPGDAAICYCFSPSSSMDTQIKLQYVDFAVSFERLLHHLGVASFLHDTTFEASAPSFG